MRPATTDDVLDLLDAAFGSAALGAAMELGLFRLLEEQPREAEGVASALGIPIDRCRYWLQLLEATALLERGPGGFSPSDTARRTILDAYGDDTWALLAQEARQRARGLRDLTDTLRLAGSAWDALGLPATTHQERMAEDPELARRFTRMLYELHRPLAQALAAAVEAGRVKRLMDLGGGSGVMSMALLRRAPRLEAVVVDIANVCAEGRRIAAENDLQDRLTYHAADFLRDELPTGFDLAMECDVCVYDATLFRKVRDALNPGGRFLILDQLAPAAGVAPPSRVHWAFLGALRRPEFTFQTADEVEQLLKSAGFEILSRRPLHVGAGTERFRRGSILIEARA